MGSYFLLCCAIVYIEKGTFIPLDGIFVLPMATMFALHPVGNSLCLRTVQRDWQDVCFEGRIFE